MMSGRRRFIFPLPGALGASESIRLIYMRAALRRGQLRKCRCEKPIEPGRGARRVVNFSDFARCRREVTKFHPGTGRRAVAVYDAVRFAGGDAEMKRDAGRRDVR